MKTDNAACRNIISKALQAIRSIPKQPNSGFPPHDRMRAVEDTSQDVLEIRAQWDKKAGVWVAESENVPGLVAEADSRNLLAQKL